MHVRAQLFLHRTGGGEGGQVIQTAGPAVTVAHIISDIGHYLSFFCVQLAEAIERSFRVVGISRVIRAGPL